MHVVPYYIGCLLAGVASSCEQFDVLVSSQGGVGSSSFMKALHNTGVSFNKANDADGSKHLSADFYKKTHHVWQLRNSAQQTWEVCNRSGASCDCML
jgi:hypothetical protein